MLKVMGVICICVASLTLFAEAPAKYEVATITDVQIHPGNGSDARTYDVSVKVGDTIYVLLYKDPLGMDTVKYAAGREGLVLVGKDNITYNDLLGESHELPIQSRRSATKQAKQPK
jgi:hypothetical protein